MTNEFKKEMQIYNAEIKQKVPEANVTVLNFITDLTCCAAVSEDQYEVIRSTFRAGYCYYFAHLLKRAFKRGEVCLAAPFGHFVWVDDNGVPYDVEGVNFGEQIYNIPESYMSENMVKEFMHIPGEEIPETTGGEIIAMIRKYEDDRGLPHQEIPYIDL